MSIDDLPFTQERCSGELREVEFAAVVDDDWQDGKSSRQSIVRQRKLQQRWIIGYYSATGRLVRESEAWRDVPLVYLP